MEDRWYGGVSMELRGPPALRAGDMRGKQQERKKGQPERQEVSQRGLQGEKVGQLDHEDRRTSVPKSLGERFHDMGKTGLIGLPCGDQEKVSWSAVQELAENWGAESGGDVFK
jgi:hypothetical protein